MLIGLTNRAWKRPSGNVERGWARAIDKGVLCIQVRCIKTTIRLGREERERRE